MRCRPAAAVVLLCSTLARPEPTRGLPPLPGAGAHTPVRVAVLDPLALENACACVAGYAQRDYKALARFLEQRLQRPVLVRFGNSLGTAKDPRGQEPDVVIGEVAEAESQAGQEGLAPRLLAMLTGRDGATTLRGLFVVRSRHPARQLGDLAGRTILLGPPSSVEKHEAALSALREAGVPIPEPLSTRDACTAAAVEVVQAKADAAVISSYALPLILGCKAVAKGELRVIGETKPVPFVGAFATAGLDPLSTALVREALLAVGNQPALCRKLESKSGFVAPGRDPKVAALLDEAPARAEEPPDSPATAGWVDWRGSPRRDAHSDAVPTTLPQRVQLLWKKPLSAQSLGGVAATRTCVIASDKTADGAKDVWRCLAADTGAEQWTLTYPAAKEMDFTSAPRTTPVIAADRVYVLGALGELYCLRLSSGEPVWHCNLLQRFGGELPTWGFCGTPLLLGDRLIVRTASLKAFLVALDPRTGKELWRAPGAPPAYGDLIVGTFGGKRQIIGPDAKGAGGWDAATGRRLWTLRPADDDDFNVPTPVQLGDRLLLSSEGNATRLYQFRPGGTVDPQPVSVNEKLRPDTTSPVCAEGMVWGTCYDGLFCLDADNGLRTVWHSNHEAFRDHATLFAGNERVLIVTHSGRLALLPATPTTATTPQWLTVLESSGDPDPEVWSQPALVGDRLYLRSDREIICILLR